MKNKMCKLQTVQKLIFIIVAFFCVTFSKAQVLQPLGNGLPSRVVASFATKTEYFALYEDLESATPNDYTLGRWNGVYWKFYPGLMTPGPIVNTMGVYNFHSIALYNNTIYIGAYIANAAKDAELPISHLYKWDETSRSWVPETGVVDTKNNGIVAMTVFDNKLIVAGLFKNTVNGKSVQNIASFDGTSWNYLGSNETSQGADGKINSLMVVGDRLYIAGDFQNFAGSYTGNIAYYTASNGGWGGIGSPFKGEISTLAYFDNQISVLGKDSLGIVQIRNFKSVWSQPISFAGYQTSLVKTIAGTPNYLLLGGTFRKNGNASSLLRYEADTLAFTGNRLTGNFTLGQRGNGAFVWGDFTEQNTGVKYFSSIESTSGNLFGDLFYDLNSNCVKDVNEVGIPNSVLRIMKKDNQKNYFAVTDQDGHFSLALPEGDYLIYNTSQRHMYSVCASNFSTKIRSGKYSSVFLGEFMDPTLKDLEVKVQPIYAVETNPGDQIKALLTVVNHGATTLSGPTIHLIHPSSITNFSSVPAPDNYENSEATFSLVNLKPFETRYIEVSLKLPGNATSSSFYPITVKTGSLFVQNDAMSTDNYDTVKVRIGKRGNVLNAVEKVSNNGEFIDYRTKTWKYTVNFRNIGNSFVNKAVFVDTISSKLPLNRIIVKSFYPVGGKPPYIQPGNVLVVNFDPANLQTYETNPSNCMGWVEYDVELYDKLPLQTQIPNTAFVNFDSKWIGYSNTCGVTIFDATASVNHLSKTGLVVYPNPAKQVLNVRWLSNEINAKWSIVNFTGEVVRTGIVGELESALDIANLSTGLYILSTPTTVTKFQVIR
jgi:hypothetical protein